MDVHGNRFECGSFHGSTWKFPLSVEVKCFNASMSFHIPLHTTIYFHDYHKLPVASTRQILTLTPTLTISWSYLHGSWPTSIFHGSRSTCMELVYCFHGNWIYLEASKEADESTWKLSRRQMKILNEATPMADSTEVNGSKLTSTEICGSIHGIRFASYESSNIKEKIDDGGDFSQL